MLTDAIINLGVGMENLQKEMKAMRLAQQETNKRLERLEKQQAKTNLALGEMRLSYMKLDARVSELDKNLSERISKLDKNLSERISELDENLSERISELDKNLSERISKLDESFNAMRSDFNKYAQRNDDRADDHETRLVRLEDKTFGSASIVSEPRAEYRKRKKRK